MTSALLNQANDDNASQYAFDWSELAFGSKKPLRSLKATFIAAPRELSEARFKELVKQYLPHGNIVLGIAKEPFVAGFEGQPQFKTLEVATVQAVIDQVNQASKTHHIYTLAYLQRELPYILEKIPLQRVVLINGSWKHAFHTSAAYYQVASSHTPYDMVSPFTDEAEAKAYEKQADRAIIKRLDAMDALSNRSYSEQDLLGIAALSATRSYDYSFQTGTALARPKRGKPGEYELVISTYNKVVPYQTYAMHHGASRETHFSPPNDLNHYDTVHAEVNLVIEAQKAAGNPKASLKDTTLFINLMPCPSCARMLSETDIEEFVYSIDHSDGYAVKMLEAAGKKVRRVVP
jgi:deoxycytidylate deaminase